MTKSRLKDALILFLITVVAGLALGAIYAITKEPIEQAKYQKTQNAYRTVFETAASFTDLEGFSSEEATAYVQNAGYTDDTIKGVVVAQDASGETLGYVITVTDSAGYGGDITFSVGYTNEGIVTGYSITEINETAGLGMNAREEKFSSQYKDIPGAAEGDTFTVVKVTPSAEGQIQAISGATFTSNAMTSGMNAAVCYGNTLIGATGGDES